MARSRRRRPGGSADSGIVAILFLVAVILALGATFGFFKYKASQRATLDSVTLCPVNGPISVTAVLLDLTDPVSRPTLQNIENELTVLAGAVPQGGELAIYALTETASTIEQQFAGCSPGDGSTVDPIIANPRQAQEQWQRGWRKPLDDFIEGLGETVSGSRSPIMAGVQQVDLQLFHSAQATTGTKNLIIFSDMIEHTDAFSIYKNGADFEKFEQSAARRMYATDLTDVGVSLFLMRRLKSPVNEMELLNFWAAWFGENGVASGKLTIRPLAGAS